jgi:hypothetical protein
MSCVARVDEPCAPFAVSGAVRDGRRATGSGTVSRWPQLPAWAKDHVGYAEDKNAEVDPRHKEPASSAVANLSGIMARRAGQFGEATPFGNEKGAADRTSGHDCPDPDEQPRFGPAQMLTRHQDDAGGEQDNCSRTEEGLPDCLGVDGESIGHRIRG